MSRYVLYRSHLRSSNSKGEFPEVVYEYVANTSMFPVMYDFTKDISSAYIFDESEKTVASDTALLLGVKIRKSDF